MTESGLEAFGGILYRQLPPWQLIKTAPDDGEPKLIFRHGWDYPRIGHYSKWPGIWIDHYTGRHIDAPTHWMTLPNPPEQGGNIVEPVGS